jgi:hypothetical protein
MPKRTWMIVGLAVVAIAAAFLLPAMPQPPAYHDFADSRTMFGVANFLDVTSNAAFLLVGVAGLVVAFRPRTRLATGAERVLYAIFFVGMVLTAGGSAYYHLAPDNETLFWDRVPMTISFMALVAAQIAERISLRAGVLLLPPMLLVGVGSVVYWRETERAGAGNVTPYGILQAFSVLVMLIIAMLPSRYSRGNDVYKVFAAYVAAKILEALDWQVLETVPVVSGHTLKHLAAALAGYFVLRMIALRSPVESAPTARR